MQRDYANIYRDGLLNDIIPFWIKNSVDREYGGFMFCVDRDGTLIDTDKGVWQIGRFTWMLATLYNEFEPRKEWIELAEHGADFLVKYCFDTDGKMFFQLTRDGKPLRKRRYVYSESFAAIAFAALYKATGNREYAKLARSCFDTYFRYTTIPGLMLPKFTENRKMKSMGGPMIGIVTAQELRKNLNDDSYTVLINNWIKEIEKDFVKDDIRTVMETVGPNGEFIDHFDGRTLNPGHAIEGAWFIMEESRYRGNDTHLAGLGVRMLDYMWETGWDKEYGGIIYFRDARGLPVQEYWQDMKMWWPQNEAVIATLLAYYHTGDKKYAGWHEMIHDYAFKNFSDPEYGEWFGYLHRDGRISVPLKGNLWKGGFHVPRMYLKALQIIKAISGKGLI
jgi:N-acylglucosamine 2-epimerase